MILGEGEGEADPVIDIPGPKLASAALAATTPPSNDVPYFHLRTPSRRSRPVYRLVDVKTITRYFDRVLVLRHLSESVCLLGILMEELDLPASDIRLHRKTETEYLQKLRRVPLSKSSK
ncbi:hypothetical protein [Ferrimicrobium acidiphilum]|jgi:hypothetical protein|uniref:hypothetical protein n=1 Tax=Ferrimicrobium acidiphilum TaxID=121039 RepID=UPI0023F4CAF5|nr:hypothetical protein [Ferrimicrobium acidiphilum]